MTVFPFILLVELIIQCSARLNEEVTIPSMSTEPHCFHQPPEMCPPLSDQCRCKKVSDTAAVCCNVDKFLLTEGLACANVKNGKVIELHIRNASLDVLNLTDSTWRQLLSLSITDGRIGKVVGEFGKHTTISCFNLSSNFISKFEHRSLVNLYNLSILDLSHNNLSDIPRFKKDGQVILDISDNNPLLCSQLLDTLKSTDVLFKNEENTFCWTSHSFNWFNATENMTLSQVVIVAELDKICYLNCSCKTSRIDFIGGKSSYSVEMNCSRLHLTSLPTTLPLNTTHLDISNNNISSLALVGSEPSYQNLRELYADNNQITSILPLEGSNFIKNCVHLSLKNNKLKSLPIYILSNVFDRNNNVQHVNLGQNRLQCDCNTAKVLKEWLLTKQRQIPDYDEIYCDNMPNTKVIGLDNAKVCQSPQEWTDYIYYIITIEVLLLVFLIAKVSYDYWVFKTAGYLPWPASQMPKLPCDWLCESSHVFLKRKRGCR